MAEAFIGLSVVTTVKDPPKARVRGLVTNAAAGELTLSKGIAEHYGGFRLGSVTDIKRSHMASQWTTRGSAASFRAKYSRDRS